MYSIDSIDIYLYIMEHLLPSQHNHFLEIIKILKKGHVYCDFSDPGTGKSEIVPILSKVLGLKLLAIVPADTIVDWKNKTKKYGTDVYEIMSYERLRGDKRYGCKHTLLVRNGDEYEITPKLLEDMREGLFIVFDEYQKARNGEKLTQKSCVAISKHVKGTKSKIGAPSSSPLDLDDQIIGMVKMLGFIKHTELLEETFVLNNKIPDSINIVDISTELLCACKDIIRDYDADVNDIMLPAVVNKNNVIHFIKHITSKIILPVISRRMESDFKHVHTIENKFFDIEPNHLSDMIKASEHLKRSIGISMFNGNKNGIRQAHNIYDMTTELVRVNIIAEEVKKLLMKTKNSKCLVFLYHYESINKFCELMYEYKSIIAVYNGKVDKKTRSKIQTKFQTQNNELRILVLNPTVGGTGKSFDDTYGDYARTVFITPSMRFIDTYQACFRASRINTASRSTTYIVFVNNAPYEKERMHKILDKIKTMETTMGFTINFPHSATMG